MAKTKKLYKPLPEYLSIGPSDIHGAGIIAKEDIPAGVEVGITHVYDPYFEDEYIRTPLGGFINHSDNPNCEIQDNDEGIRRILHTSKRIEAGEELTITYTLYKL